MAQSSTARAINRAGIELNDGTGPFRTLNVFDLTTDIAPASGIDGVLFTSNGAVTLNVDPGPFSIVTTDANGIFASSNGGTVTINSTADIVTIRRQRRWHPGQRAKRASDDHVVWQHRDVRQQRLRHRRRRELRRR